MSIQYEMISLRSARRNEAVTRCQNPRDHVVANIEGMRSERHQRRWVALIL